MIQFIGRDGQVLGRVHGRVEVIFEFALVTIVIGKRPSRAITGAHMCVDVLELLVAESNSHVKLIVVWQ